MKKILVVLLITLFSSMALQAAPFSKMATQKPILVQKGEKKLWCSVCGMNLKMFYKTSHSATLEDGTPRQYCSIRCLADDMKHHTLNLHDVKVVDATTQKLIPASDAYYVVGSKVKGTMSKVSKIAFATKSEAESFAKEFSGKIVDFKTALEMAKSSLDKDTMMLMKKKEKKIYPMGKKIFTKMCNQNIDVSKYRAINELKSAIVKEKLCKPLKEKQLQALSLYLFEAKSHHAHQHNISITKDEKCPVCGMFVYKYPKWVAQIFYKDGGVEKHLSFDGAKDMFKFYFNPNKWGKYTIDDKSNKVKILVTDYYSQKVIDATKAYYVIGSDVYGPMGDELIPFKSKADAKSFSMDHKGKQTIQFSDVTKSQVYALDD